MKKYTIAYVFRKPVHNTLNLIAQQKAPRDMVYGLTYIQKKFHVITPAVSSYIKVVNALQYILNTLIAQFVDTIGFSLIPTILIASQLQKADLIFATADTYGLPIALLKKLHIINKPLVFNTVGLYDALIRKSNLVVRLLYARILNTTVDRFVSGGSFQECEKLAHLLAIPLNRFTFIPFGIDTKFFHQIKTKELNEILTIGVDPSRDWDLFIAITKKMPKETFRLITYRGLVKSPLPPNIICEYNLSFEEIRNRIWRAQCVVLLTKHNHYFSGQSTMFRSMACAKPVIMTNSPSITAYNLRDRYNCILVPEGDEHAVNQAIQQLNNDAVRKKIGLRARTMILNDCTIKQYGEKLTEVFQTILTKA